MINLVAMLNAHVFSHSVVSDSIVISWTVTHPAPLSLGFLRQEYWSELPFPPPGDLPEVSCIAGGFFTTTPPGKPAMLNAFPQIIL